MSPQSKYWGDVSPLSHRDRRPWFVTSVVQEAAAVDCLNATLSWL